MFHPMIVLCLSLNYPLGLYLPSSSLLRVSEPLVRMSMFKSHGVSRDLLTSSFHRRSIHVLTSS